MNNSTASLSASAKLELFQRKTYDFMDKLFKKLVKKSYLLLSFIIPVLIVSITFAFLGIFPYGDNSILTLDMNGQYVYFFEHFRDILTGESSFFYTFQRSLGGEFLGYYTYYLASPLSLLVAFFPSDMITEAIMTIMIIKSGLAGLTFAIYLDRTRKKNVPGFVMFSVMYALCSYATVLQSNTMWMDALIWLPLITLGIESLIKEGKFKLFTISLALAIWSNYYIGYMICIFVLLYFFFYYFSHSSEEINPKDVKLHLLKSIGKIALASIIAILMAGVVICTAYYALSFGKNDLQQNSFEPYLRMDILNLVTKLFFGSYDTIRGESTPNLYAGTLTLILLPIFFISKKVKTREKIGYVAICAVFVLSMLINTLDLVWHGFQMPIWLNYRYSFLLSFLLLTMAYKGYESLEDAKGKTFGFISVGLVALLAIIQKTVTLTKYVYNGDIQSQQQVTPSYEVVWSSIAIIAVYTILLIAFSKVKKKQIITVILAICVCIEALASTMFNWTEEILDAGWTSRSTYREFQDKTSELTEFITENDDDFYRMEINFARKANDNLALNINGISEFTSTFNMSVRDLLAKLGYRTDFQTINYTTGNVLADTLLGVKYVIQRNNKNDDGTIKNEVSELYEHAEFGDFIVYQNPFALPIAYSVDEGVKNLELHASFGSSSEYAENILNAMLKDELEITHDCTYGKDDFVNCGEGVVDADGKGTSYYRVTDGQKASFVFKVTAPTEGNMYMFLPTLYNTPADCFVNGNYLCTLFQENTYKTQSLGFFKQGEVAEVKLEFDAGRIYLLNEGTYFTQFSNTNLGKFSSILREGGLVVSEHSDTYIKGTIKESDRDVVFTSIPYDECWNIYVDGEKIEGYKCIGTLLAFDLPENGKSEHTVELKYVPKYFNIGLFLSVLGIALFVAWCIFERKMKKWKLEAEAEGSGEEFDEGFNADYDENIDIEQELIPDSEEASEQNDKILENEDKNKE